jgi:virulence factor Mce-like protein
MKKVLSMLLIPALAVAAFVGYGVMRPELATYSITADVEQAPNLFAGGRVMVRGVDVGEITDVTPRTEGVRITIEIDEAVKVPADASLAVVPITVIADRYIQLYPAYAGGATLADGDHIPANRTSIPAELDDVLTQLDGLLEALKPRAGERRGPLARLIREADAALKGNAEVFAGTIEGSATVLENLADSRTDLTGLIRNLDRLFATLADRSSEIGLLNERFSLVAQALQQDQANLEGTIENVTFLSEEATALIRESGDELGESFARLERVLDVVLAHQRELHQGFTWTNVIAEALGATDRSGRGLHAYTGRQAPPGTPESVYNYRIDTRDTIACERIGALVESFLVLNPDPTVEEIRETLLNFIPETYRDDLTFLIDLLTPLCADYPGEPVLDARSRALVASIAEEIGEERFGALMARWFLEDFEGEVTP